ncbi:MAG: hypothetical protein WCK98_00715 [bacterium]
MNVIKKTKVKNSGTKTIIEKLREFELALNLSSNLSKSDLKKLKSQIQNGLLKKLQSA